jgi:Domain of unknown function (DUF4177)
MGLRLKYEFPTLRLICQSGVENRSRYNGHPIQLAALWRAKRKESDMKEYKVLTQKDRFFGGKFDPEKLEKGIKSYATEGWSVVSVATASIPSLSGTREEMIVVMEREK